jgi:hypothetical protein
MEWFGGGTDHGENDADGNAEDDQAPDTQDAAEIGLKFDMAINIGDDRPSVVAGKEVGHAQPEFGGDHGQLQDYLGFDIARALSYCYCKL